MFRPARLLSASVLGAIVVSSSSAAPTAWVLNTLPTIDMVNVATNASVPFGTTPFMSHSLARTPTGSLISADPLGALWDVTGAPIPLGPTGRTQIGDLDFGVGGVWGYSNSSDELFFFDLSSFTVTYSQIISVPSTATIEGVAYQPSTGDVYLSAYTGLNTDYLLRVPPSATSATLVGPIPNADPFSYFADIDFAPSGQLIGMTFYHRYFYDISTVNASSSLISTGPHRDTTGMALDPVPEPATLAVLAAGILAMRRRVRPI